MPVSMPWWPRPMPRWRRSERRPILCAPPPASSPSGAPEPRSQGPSPFGRYWSNSGHCWILSRDGSGANDPTATFGEPFKGGYITVVVFGFYKSPFWPFNATSAARINIKHRTATANCLISVSPLTASSADQVDQIYERFAAALERSEWLPRKSLDSYSNQLLERLVSFASVHSPFYRGHLKPLFRDGSRPDLRLWSEIPILTRDHIEREIDQINPTYVPDELGPVLSVRTSGTTSERFSFRNSYLARMAASCMMHRLYRWSGFDLSAPFASIRAYDSDERHYPEGVTEARWSYPGPPAPHFTIDVRTPIAQLIDWLARRRPTYLLTFPSILHEMAVHPDSWRVAEIGLKRIIAISEIVSPDLRSFVRTRFGCEIEQFYACAEIGCIAVQSPIDEACLVCEETALVEILDDAGKPVAPGETGRVVLTSFYNYATPFIRYAVGDFATQAVEGCPSGRTLKRLERIEGRSRNALIAADGRRIWPNLVITPSLLKCVSVPLFQIQQPQGDQINLLLASSDGNAEPNQNQLMDYFNSLLGRPINLTITRVDRISRSVSGKLERIVSAISY